MKYNLCMPTINRDIQPAVEGRLIDALLAGGDPQAGADPDFVGRLTLACLADEAAAQYTATRVRGIVIHYTQQPRMRYVAAGAIARELAAPLAGIAPTLRTALHERLAALAASYEPAAEAILVTVDGATVRPALRVRLADHEITRADTGAATVGGEFRLPAEITMTKETIPGGWAYVFHHQTLGLLGRLVLRGRGTAHTQIDAEVAGHPDDPQTAVRQAILRPLTDELTRLVEQRGTPTAGPPPARATPLQTSRPPQRIASKLIPCSRCGQSLAFLVFADDGTLEDHARLMYPHIREQGLPTYIIGPPEGSGPLEQRPGAVQQVYPERGPVQRLSMRDFDQVVATLEATHCGNRATAGSPRARQ